MFEDTTQTKTTKKTTKIKKKTKMKKDKKKKNITTPPPTLTPSLNEGGKGGLWKKRRILHSPFAPPLFEAEFLHIILYGRSGVCCGRRVVGCFQFFLYFLNFFFFC